MPPGMSMSPNYRGPAGGQSIEVGNRLGTRPVVRQSQFYRTNESGNQMKDVLGHSHLSWDTQQQQGVFAGQAVYDASAGAYNAGQYAAGRQSSSPPMQSRKGAGTQQAPWDTAAQLTQPFGQPQLSSPSQSLPFVQQTPFHPSMPKLSPSQPMAPSNGIIFGGGGAAAADANEVEYPWPGSVASCDACGEVVNRYYHCTDCQEETGLFDLCVRCWMQRISHPTHVYETHAMTHVTPVEPEAQMGASSGGVRNSRVVWGGNTDVMSPGAVAQLRWLRELCGCVGSRLPSPLASGTCGDNSHGTAVAQCEAGPSQWWAHPASWLGCCWCCSLWARL